MKIKYNIISYPLFLFILFDFKYSELFSFKVQIIKLIEEKITFEIKEQYKFVGLSKAQKKEITITH